MNRRSFFKKLAMATAAFTVLPSATTYARKWVTQAASPLLVPNPAWVNAEFEMHLIMSPAFGIMPQAHQPMTHPIIYNANTLPPASSLSSLPIVRYREAGNGVLEQVPEFINA